MAKKENKIEVISEETVVVDSNENVNKKEIPQEDVKILKNIHNMTLTELVYVEKAINIVCKRSENALRNYDGTISKNSKEYDKFQKLNKLHTKVINKLEEELLNIEVNIE